MRPLIDGSVAARDFTLDMAVSDDTRQRQVDAYAGKYDACEFYICTYIADRESPRLGMTAIPIYVKRTFRHSYIYINRRSSIKHPSDLQGGRIGLPSWFTSTAVWVKGMLEDDYGLDLSSVEWVSNFTERHTGLSAPDWVNITGVPPGESLHSLLLKQELDAVISTGLWAPFGHRDIGFLFENYQEVERDYFARTRCFPIMHVLLIRDALLAEHPWIAMSMYEAWQGAKEKTYEWLRWQRVHQTSMWYRGLWEEEQAVCDGDPYRWGLRESRHELDLLLEYCQRQGLTSRRLAPEELFHASTLDT